MRYIILFVVLIVILGCGEKAEEKAAEKIMEKVIASNIGDKATVDIEGENIQIKTKDGTMRITSGESAELPSGFPKDIFLYDNADLNSSMALPEGYTLSFQTKDDPLKVSETYLKEMAANGWSKEMSMDMGEQKMLGFQKEQRVVNVIISPDEDATRIGLTVQKE